MLLDSDLRHVLFVFVRDFKSRMEILGVSTARLALEVRQPFSPLAPLTRGAKTESRGHPRPRPRRSLDSAPRLAEVTGQHRPESPYEGGIGRRYVSFRLHLCPRRRRRDRRLPPGDD